LLTNGGAEAISLLSGELSGQVVEPEFALHPRGGGGPRWRSNPHNPTGLLAAPTEAAGVWDEAFYPLATGQWTRGDVGVPVVGSLTKLLSCPGLRVGYLLADPELVQRCASRQPGWSVNGLACAALPDLLQAVDLARWAAETAALREQLVDVLTRHGLPPRPSDANWVLVDAPGLREELATHGVLVRDCTSFGLAGVARIAVPDADGLARLDRALAARRERREPSRSPASTWPRPRPLVGDRSSSSERAADPTAWAMAEQTRAALAEVIAARRDIRRFRADPVDDAILRRVMAAGHSAPSVGHSHPWRFVVVRDPATRTAAAAMADRARLEQAAQLDEVSANHLRSLQLEGLREAPIGVVVCCDRRVRPAGVLGRATYPDTDLWSCACAIENMWLTARAEGLGVGWVTLFDPSELAALLGLPEGIETLGWLCLGWPDERPPEPGLERQGWSQRLPLDQVVIDERWSEPAAGVPVDRTQADRRAARLSVRDREDALLAAPGALGLLGDALLRAETLSDLDKPGTLLIAAADHPVTALGVSAFPPDTTALIASALAQGAGQGAAAAADAGMGVRLVDCGIHGPLVDGWLDRRTAGARGDLASAPAMTVSDASELVAAGEALGRELVSDGAVAIGEVGIGNTTIASAVAGAVLGLPPAELIGRGAGSDTATIARKHRVVEQALGRVKASG
ncbi:MAG TPA: 5,6-dimethylbenzimidazole synthase, partial [Mycobacteriales bacterium]|nr:5,6-dimethylbenzimidazole synthase [Mycobacteriales bacterium]